MKEMEQCVCLGRLFHIQLSSTGRDMFGFFFPMHIVEANLTLSGWMENID